jgi:hypothetical protein
MAPIRDIALASFNASNGRGGNHPSDGKHSTARRLADSLKNPHQSRNKRAGPSTDGRPGDSPKRLRAGSIGEDVIVIDKDSRAAAGPSKPLTEDHDSVKRETENVMSTGGDEKMFDPRKVLKLFRVDQKKLA